MSDYYSDDSCSIGPEDRYIFESDNDSFSDIKPPQIYKCSDTSMESSDDSSDSDSKMSDPPSPVDTSRFRHCFLQMGDEMEL